MMMMFSLMSFTIIWRNKTIFFSNFAEFVKFLDFQCKVSVSVRTKVATRQKSRKSASRRSGPKSQVAKKVASATASQAVRETNASEWMSSFLTSFLDPLLHPQISIQVETNAVGRDLLCNYALTDRCWRFSSRRTMKGIERSVSTHLPRFPFFYSCKVDSKTRGFLLDCTLFESNYKCLVFLVVRAFISSSSGFVPVSCSTTALRSAAGSCLMRNIEQPFHDSPSHLHCE